MSHWWAASFYSHSVPAPLPTEYTYRTATFLYLHRPSAIFPVFVFVVKGVTVVGIVAGNGQFILDIPSLTDRYLPTVILSYL